MLILTYSFEWVKFSVQKPAIEGGKPVRENFLVFGKPDIREEEIKEVFDTLKSGWIGQGPKVEEFEEEFRKYIGTKNAVAVNSCTAGLFLALEVIGIEEGDEVIVPVFTFPATANVVVHHKATPVFCDVDIRTGNITPEEVKRKITPKTKAIIMVHFAGMPCRVDEIKEIAEENDIYLIEDAAHAIEAWYKKKKIGTTAHLSAFSFYATKNLTTAEGGMVTTESDEWAEEIRIKRLHGISKHAWSRYRMEGFLFYETLYAGYKMNMTDIQASLGIHQLRRIEKNLKKREELWNLYTDAFLNNPFLEVFHKEWSPDIKHAMHLYTILLKTERLKITREQFIEALKRENIGVGIHFIPLHWHKFYKNGFKKGDFPNADYLGERIVSLPLSSWMSKKDAEDVIKAVDKITQYYAC